MNNKCYVSEDNKDKTFTIVIPPKMVFGKLYVWLREYRGCYAADGLEVVQEGNLDGTDFDSIIYVFYRLVN